MRSTPTPTTRPTWTSLTALSAAPTALPMSTPSARSAATIPPTARHSTARGSPDTPKQPAPGTRRHQTPDRGPDHVHPQGYSATPHRGNLACPTARPWLCHTWQRRAPGVRRMKGCRATGAATELGHGRRVGAYHATGDGHTHHVIPQSKRNESGAPVRRVTYAGVRCPPQTMMRKTVCTVVGCAAGAI